MIAPTPLFSGLEIALAHAALGRKVFPMALTAKAGGGFDKRPIVKWKTEATTNAKAIHQMWKRHPEAVAAWQLPPGAVIIDVDDAAAFEATGLVLPEAPYQTTPSGGFHLLFEGTGKQWTKQIPGLDTRIGERGLVGLYQLDSFTQHPVKEPPAFLVDHERARMAQEAPEPGEQLTTRAEIVALAGRLSRDGLEGEQIDLILRSMLDLGQIYDSNPDDPWTAKTLRQIAMDLGSKPKPSMLLGGLGAGKYGQAKAALDPKDSGALVSTMEEYSDDTDTNVSWLAEGLAYFGGVSLLAGSPKAGKSTLLADLVRASNAASSMAGHWAAERCPVLLLTEEVGIAVVYKFRGMKMDVLDNATAALNKLSWHDSLNLARMWAAKHPRSLVIIDTLAVWARVRDENDASEMTRAIIDVKNAFADQDVAVILVHHARKGGGANGEGIRGSSAIAASVDLLLEFHYATDNTSDDRILSRSGRVIFPERDLLTFERGSKQYAWKDWPRAHEEAVGWWDAIPDVDQPGMAKDDLAIAWGISIPQAERRLRVLRVDAGAFLLLESASGQRKLFRKRSTMRLKEEG